MVPKRRRKYRHCEQTAGPSTAPLAMRLRETPLKMTIFIPINHLSFNHTLADEDCAAVDVEDFAGDEAGEGGAEEENGRGDLVDVGGTAKRDQGQQLLGRFWIAKDVGGHLGGDPAGGDAVAVDALADEFGGEAFGEADEGSFGGGVVGVEGFAALAGGGTDENDVAADPVHKRLRLHLSDGGADYAEDAVEVGAEGASPLGSCHGGDGGFVGGPDAVVQDGAVEAAEGGYRSGDEGLAILRRGKGLVDGAAEVGASTLGYEFFCLFRGGEVAEDDLRAGLAEETYGGGADSAGASGNEGDFS